jgi:hypothetical protein
MLFLQPNVCTSKRTPHAPSLMLQVAGRGYAELLRTPLRRCLQNTSAQVGTYEKRYFAFRQTIVRWRASSELFARSVHLQQHSLAQHRNAAQRVLCFRTCTETPCNPKRSPLSEMTSPARATAVFSLLPVPSRIASNSALESASGPSDNSRSRGLSSGGSCLMVYLRPCTWVFYIIQVTGVRIQVSAASVVMRVSSNSASASSCSSSVR